MTRISPITARQQVASFGVAAVVSLGLLGSMTGLAHRYDTQALQQARSAETHVAVQTVVVVAKRPA